MKYLDNWNLFNLFESLLSESEMSSEQLDIYHILQELIDNGFDVEISNISAVTKSDLFEVSINSKKNTRAPLSGLRSRKTESLFTWSEVKESVMRVYDYVNSLRDDKNWARIEIRMWMDSVEVGQGFTRSEQFTIPDGTTQWTIRLLIRL